MSASNRRILLASRPAGEPGPDNFRLVEEPIPEPGDGQMLLRTIYLSLDPYMRGRMSDAPSYAAPVEVGGVMEGRGVCAVVSSNFAGYAPGDLVVATTGWQEYVVVNGKAVQRVPPELRPITY